MQFQLRNRGLDVTRALAVVLVLFRHGGNPQSLLYRVGWLGVDLFFVISGFIITMLLFEYAKKEDSLDASTFLWRRILKIVPPFYLFAFVSIAVLYWNQSELPSYVQLFSEFLYLQSYVSRIWQHTWSLAVEAHFYLLVFLLLHFIGCKKLLSNVNQKIYMIILLLSLTFFLRWQVSWPHRHEAFFDFMGTHLRFDGILFGVLSAFLYQKKRVSRMLTKKRIPVVITAVLLLLPSLWFEGGSFFMNTWGLSIVNAGFAVTVLLMHSWEKLNGQTSLAKPFYVMQEIGLASYSIYLWHLTGRWLVSEMVPESSGLFEWCYIAVALLLGMALYQLVEKPIFRYRHKIVAAIQGGMSVHSKS